MSRFHIDYLESKNLLENQALDAFVNAFEPHLPGYLACLEAFHVDDEVDKYAMAFYPKDRYGASTSPKDELIKELRVFFLKDFTPSRVYLTFVDGRMFELAPHEYRELAHRLARRPLRKSLRARTDEAP